MRIYYVIKIFIENLCVKNVLNLIRCIKKALYLGRFLAIGGEGGI